MLRVAEVAALLGVTLGAVRKRDAVLAPVIVVDPSSGRKIRYYQPALIRELAHARGLELAERALRLAGGAR